MDVERTLAWISRCCRLARDDERHARKAAAFVRLAMIRLRLRRLAARPRSKIQPSRIGSYDVRVHREKMGRCQPVASSPTAEGDRSGKCWPLRAAVECDRPFLFLVA